MSDPLTLEQFLDALPEARRDSVSRVWQVVRDNVRDGFTEEITAKYLTLKAGNEWFVALASPKSYLSLHLTAIYVLPELREKWDAAAAGGKFQTGKGCINFKNAGDLPLDAVAEIIAACDAETYQRRVQEYRAESKKARVVSC